MVTLTRIISLAVAGICLTGSLMAQSVAAPIVSESTFGHYVTGWECARASSWWEGQFWRDKRPDTTYYPRTGHPTQRSTDATVGRCVSRFNLGTTAQRDLLGSIQAYLAAGQDAQADAAATKLISSVAASPTQVKAWALYQLSDVYLGDAEPKLAKAEQFIKQLDAMGAPAAVERMLAHSGFANTVRFRDSVPLWERELNAALVASKEMVGDTRKEYAYESAGVYLGIADFKGRMNDPRSAIESIATARTELIPLRPSLERYLGGRERPYEAMGKPAQPVQATRWFNTNGNNIHPASGKPALLVFVSHSCGSFCYPDYAVLKRIRAKFEAKGLDVVLMTRTQGFYRNQLVKPDAEINHIGEYFTNHIGLPINLAVWEAQFGKRDDGKITVLSAPNDQAYNVGSVYLIDSKGMVRLVLDDLKRRNEAIVEDVITEMF